MSPETFIKTKIALIIIITTKINNTFASKKNDI